jgi:ApaG protein
MIQQTAITEGVLVKVNTKYRGDFSTISEGVYYFNYHIIIENQNNYSIQLIHRDWFIYDVLFPAAHVSGEGVIGQQPILEAGEVFSYTSGCELRSEIGSMSGFYTFLNLVTNETIRVDIPSFNLIYPGRLN